MGSALVPELILNGFIVTVFDTFWFGKSQFENLINLTLIEGDIRNTADLTNAMNGQDAIIHLACISNDPSFDLDPKLGKAINLDSFSPLIRVAKKSRIKRFIYASSSSVYGLKSESRVTEDLTAEPLTDYSKYKYECEQILLSEVNNEFAFCIVRPATICGYSPRQRFDLVVNILTASAILDKKITVTGGPQFRPNLHIRDMVDAYLLLLNVDSLLMNRKIYNIGGENLNLIQIANVVKENSTLDCEITFTETNDLRSYRIDSTKIKNELGFVPRKSIKEAVIDIVHAHQQGKFEKDLKCSKYINISRMKELRVT